MCLLDHNHDIAYNLLWKIHRQLSTNVYRDLLLTINYYKPAQLYTCYTTKLVATALTGKHALVPQGLLRYKMKKSCYIEIRTQCYNHAHTHPNSIFSRSPIFFNSSIFSSVPTETVMSTLLHLGPLILNLGNIKVQFITKHAEKTICFTISNVKLNLGLKTCATLE